jgi:tetratricopeptide (TPR) repeat protein
MIDSRDISDLTATARRLATAGDWGELRRLLTEHEEDARVQPELATLRAESELRTGRAREAHRWLTEVLAALGKSGDRAALRKATNQLGVADVELGALDDAERTFGRALELARADGDDLLVARATNNMGAIANIRGQRDEALLLYQLAIPAYQRLGHVAGLAESFHNMAISYRHLGQLDRSDEYEQRAIGYASECANASLLALARLGRAEVSLQAGDARLAEVGAQLAASEFSGIPDPIREADAQRLLGAARLALRKYNEANAALARALELARAHGSALVEAEALRTNAELLAATGDRVRAREDAQLAAETFTRLGALALRDEVVRWLAELERD